ncbi:MAG: hypothetical protein KIT84_35895 [Labilithrix sp.]|nr:hypothetical protein [Labilithrix sp.]MCW5816437.1 hypothetical protein [Labilithrix sp.]
MTATLEKRDRYDVRSLDAASLVLLDRDAADAERALVLLERLRDRAPEDHFLESLARHRLGKEATLARDVTGAPAPPGDRATIFYFLRGLYYARVRGLDHLAREDFERAAEGAHANVYSQRARSMLAERAADEGPSSLAPQVVAKREE